ncbi:hypothetical protein M426DRAFT_64245 [Hypoxylon sp. CI-4A]|nr:hypothetical protein M426DRAFT_64245 [Hypoxylon sp. CI-4A]
MDPLRILIAPTGFQTDLQSDRVADYIEEGVRRVFSEESAFIRKVPLYDGEGSFSQSLIALHDGELRKFEVNDPFYKPILCSIGFINDNTTAVLDLTVASIPKPDYNFYSNPTTTTSYGIGELLVSVLDAGCTEIIIDYGDWGARDGGAGILQALGAKFLDEEGNELLTISGASELYRIADVSLRDIHPRLKKIRLVVVCSSDEMHSSSHGGGMINGLENATEDQIEKFFTGKDKFRATTEKFLKKEHNGTPLISSVNSLGIGLGVIGADFRERSDAAKEYLQTEGLFDKPWDLMITGAMCLTSQSPIGKMALDLAQLARKHGIHTIAIAGLVQGNVKDIYDQGVDSFASAVVGPESSEKKTSALVADATERSMRMVAMGLSMKRDESG